MNFIKQTEFQHLKQKPEDYSDNFESTSGWFCRQSIFAHTLQYLLHIKQLQNQQEAEGKALEADKIRQIRHEDTAISLTARMMRQYLKIVAQKKPGEKLDQDDIFQLVTATFKTQILILVGCLVIDTLFRLGFSVLILYLFEAVAAANPTLAYIYSAILAFVFYLSQLFKQKGAVYTYFLVSKLKAALAMLLYAKVSKLTSCVMRSSDAGKLTNLLANDLGVLEQRVVMLTFASVFPVQLIGLTIILITRIGWGAVVGILVIVAIVPLSVKVSKKNGGTIEEINKFKDSRVKTTTEAIEGIKYIKLYGWELAFKKIIQNIRVSEVTLYRLLAVGRAVERAIGNSLGFIGSFVMFIVAYYASTGLTLAKIFSTLEVATALKQTIIMMALGLGVYYEIKVVFGRFANIFNIENTCMLQIDEATKQEISRNQSPDPKNNNTDFDTLVDLDFSAIDKDSIHLAIQLQIRANGEVVLENFNGYWKKEFASPSLKGINLRFRCGQFYGITGKVGSGKSGLLGAILGQIPYYSGKLSVTGSIAYVEQEPIVFSDTVRNNITFGRKFNKARYEQATRLSCLTSDFEILEHGDMTIVGEKGITLSGGQKARLSLARSLYADADIYLFDDPISAVDSKVAKLIHENCLLRLKNEKTVVLVTHQIAYLYDCDEVIVMKDGAVQAKGSPRQLKRKLEELSEVFKTEAQEEACQKEQKEITQQKIRKMSAINQQSEASSKGESKVKPAQMQTRFIEKQARVGFSTYLRLFLSNPKNYFLLPLTILLFCISEGILAVYYRFLSDYDNIATNTSAYFGSNATYRQFWGILGLLIALHFLVLTIKYYCLNICLLNSSTQIHENMIEAIVRSPGSFFDSTPSGMLTNKFSNDLGIIDNGLISAMVDSFEGPVAIISAIINICQIDVYILIPSALVMLFAVAFFVYSRAAVIGTKQLDLQNKAPIFHFFSQTVNGLTQIKVYNRRPLLIQDFTKLLNNSTRSAMCFDLVSRGFGFYETLTCIVLMLAGMILGIVQSSPENNGSYGIIVLYLIAMSEVLQWILRQIISVQSLMVSAERILQFSSFQQEKALRTDYDKTIGLTQEVEAMQRQEDLHQEWPENAIIQLQNLSARYKPGLPLALNNVSFRAQKSQKVGIVGRTGAGKSSIIQALFRIFEPELGSLYKIGEHNALEMGLHSLRQHISVIPQTPFLFKASVKVNIDPFSTASEEQIWKVLEESGLAEHVKSLPKSLETDISNTSENFSVGQKQLLCLARALLRRNKFLVLDEATSNVDIKTDSFIQKVLKEQFKETTIITIAHRLITVADYDKIIVMHRGRIAEQGAPHELIEKKGMFYEMVQHSGKSAEAIKFKAREAYQRHNGIR